MTPAAIRKRDQFKVGDIVKVERGLTYEVDAVLPDGSLNVTIIENGKRVEFCNYPGVEAKLFQLVSRRKR